MCTSLHVARQKVNTLCSIFFLIYSFLSSETTVILREENYVWPGVHKVTLKITDQQGKSCADAQIIDLTVCTCNKNTKSCVSRSTSTATFGAAGILLMLLGLLLLLCE